MYYWVTRSYWSRPFLCTPGSRYNSRTSWTIPHSCSQLLSWATWNWRARPASRLTGIITCLSILFLQLACTIKQMQRSSIRYWERGGGGRGREGGGGVVLTAYCSQVTQTVLWHHSETCTSTLTLTLAATHLLNYDLRPIRMYGSQIWYVKMSVFKDAS